MTRSRRIAIVGGVVAVAVVALALVFRKPANEAPASESDHGPEPGGPWFVDVTRDAGIDFVHFDPTTDSHFIQETMGSGLGWIDYDTDGWPDLFCVQDAPVRPTPGTAAPSNRLYRNNRDGTFTDVTERAGLVRNGFGQGCAVGDFDNDGYDDLAVTYLPGLVLYRNNGNGTFADVTAAAGLANPHWGTSCAWGDVDNDGRLDLYVCNYVEVDIDRYPVCERDGRPFICPPTSFPHVHHRLFRNLGGGRFADVSAASGIAAAPPAPGLGVVATDVDGDGKLDLFVANDLKPQYLFHNQGGRFVEKGLLSGAGLGGSGQAVSGMGVEAFDVDGTGRPSLFVTNFFNQPNVLYRNRGNVRFREAAAETGLAGRWDRLGFGTVALDANLDGRPDVAIANGHLHRDAAVVYRAPYAQPPQLFVGTGPGTYRDASDRTGPFFREPRVGRGLAWADYDNDGKPDLAFSHVGGPPALLHNRTETANGWLGLELVGDGKGSNRNAIGARVEVQTAGGSQVRLVNGGGSYLSASERRLLIGLSADRAGRVRVRWPSGREQVFEDVPAGMWWRLTEGSDRPTPRPIGGR